MKKLSRRLTNKHKNSTTADDNRHLQDVLGVHPVADAEDTREQEGVHLPAVHHELMVASCDYSAELDNELSFQTSDIIDIQHLEVYKPSNIQLLKPKGQNTAATRSMTLGRSEYCDTAQPRNEFWWLAKHLASGNYGYIYRPMLAQLHSLESQIWYFGKFGRKKAESWFNKEQHQAGTFCVHEATPNSCGRFKGEPKWFLSVVDRVRHQETVVKHYEMYLTRTDSDGHREFVICCESTASRNGQVASGMCNVRFRRLCDLIEHMTQNHLLCQRLAKPCQRPPVVIYETRLPIELPRSAIVVDKEIGRGDLTVVVRGYINMGHIKKQVLVVVHIIYVG